ncbi:hypothetical protein [Roseomonas sp. AR75]|uniref:hypothetical protein n=1 Tax=Roseomonas sp. AR75 TaxID=2562311 RepID=UPI0010BF8539|nr:hypothetical protein [Roseomonas sp. AR75]
MDPLEFVTDRSIRRALGFAGLGIGMVMLALSFDLPLALRSGADLVAIVAVALLVIAWRTPHRDIRRSESWMMLNDLLPEAIPGVPRAEVQRRLKETLRRRLLWHAERVGMLAVALWSLTLLAALLR